jgi:hypothetical protein
MTGATDISCNERVQWSVEFCRSAEMFTDKSVKRLAAISHPVHSPPRQRPRVNLSEMPQISTRWFLHRSKIRRFRGSTCLSKRCPRSTKQRNSLPSVETNCVPSLFRTSFIASEYLNTHKTC